jgi:hypothetical protein
MPREVPFRLQDKLNHLNDEMPDHRPSLSLIFSVSGLFFNNIGNVYILAMLNDFGYIGNCKISVVVSSCCHELVDGAQRAFGNE